MTHYAQWASYTGAGALILAVVLAVIAAVLALLASRLRQPIALKRPGAALTAYLVVCLLLATLLFLVAAGTYGNADIQQHIRFTGPVNTIFPVTATLCVLAFTLIFLLERHRGFRIAAVSAVVGVMAAPLIFELPFDLIVMGRTYPPSPGADFTLLYFLPLFLIETTSFALLAVAPGMRIARSTLLLLAGMFLVFAVWALFGFTYPAWPLPIALNIISKALAFAVSISLFVPPGALRSALALAPALTAGERTGLT